MDISCEQGNLSCSSGLGVHFTLPTKARNPKRKTQTQASSTLDPLSKQHRLETKLAQLLAPNTLNDQAIPAGSQNLAVECAEAWEDSEEACAMHNFPGDGYNIEESNHPFTSSDTVCSTDSLKIGSGNTRCLTPNQAAINLYAKWQATVPTLVDDILSYYSSSVGRKIKPVNGLVEEGCPSCICVEFKSLNILVLYFNHESAFFVVSKSESVLNWSRFQHDYSHSLFMSLNCAGPCQSRAFPNCSLPNLNGSVHRFSWLLFSSLRAFLWCSECLGSSNEQLL